MRSLSKFAARLVAWTLALALLVGAILYPSDMNGHYANSRGGQDSVLVHGVEDYGRHVNTVIPIGMAVVLRDIKGLGQILAVTVFGKVTVETSKRALNDVEVSGTRLGQRPNGGNRNMPSGHSALASAGAYIAVRRYSRWFGIIVWPVLLATMYARYMLDEHTLSATIAGAGVGILVAALFVRPARNLWRSRSLQNCNAKDSGLRG